MSQVLPSSPENDATPIYDSRYGLQTAGMLQGVVHAHFRLTLLADKLWSHFQALDNRNTKGIMSVICPGRSEMGKSFNRQRQMDRDPSQLG